jgi:hypothetical protein
VPTLQREAGFRCVVERPGIDGPEFGAAPAMLDVTRRTITRDRAMDPFLCGDPVDDDLVTLEAANARRAGAALVALAAFAHAFQRRMCGRQRSGRNPHLKLGSVRGR